MCRNLKTVTRNYAIVSQCCGSAGFAVDSIPLRLTNSTSFNGPRLYSEVAVLLIPKDYSPITYRVTHICERTHILNRVVAQYHKIGEITRGNPTESARFAKLFGRCSRQ